MSVAFQMLGRALLGAGVAERDGVGGGRVGRPDGACALGLELGVCALGLELTAGLAPVAALVGEISGLRTVAGGVGSVPGGALSATVDRGASTLPVDLRELADAADSVGAACDRRTDTTSTVLRTAVGMATAAAMRGKRIHGHSPERRVHRARPFERAARAGTVTGGGVGALGARATSAGAVVLVVASFGDGAPGAGRRAAGAAGRVAVETVAIPDDGAGASCRSRTRVCSM